MIPHPSFHRQAVVQTGARLHFGLIRVGESERRFGGLGVIIEEPRLKLSAQPAERWSCAGPFCDRLLPFAKSLLADYFPQQKPSSAMDFRVESAPPEHSGLGSGTQLTLAAAAAIYGLAGQSLPSPRQFALETGRGKRSAIGCHGFYLGGLLFDGGKQDAEPLAELHCRVDFPSQWRFVLIRPRAVFGASGAMERKLFQSAPSKASDFADAMTALARETIIPAAVECQFQTFSEALYQYGCLAGESLAFFQGDTFSSPEIRRHVEDLRRRGVSGVGQSSWGPTVFALLEHSEGAEHLREELHSDPLYRDCEIWITAARNEGATISVTSLPQSAMLAAKSQP